MKWFWLLAVGAFVVLGAVAVWMGGLNQDEGWYLYAAQLVGEGKVPYRDFFFTQGPLMPAVYSVFGWVWKDWGLLGARVLTLAFGIAGIFAAMALARRHAPQDRRGLAMLMVLLLLGCNLYHLYYVAIPKTYALAALFILIGFYLLDVPRLGWLAGVALAFAAGTRISMGALLPVVGVALIVRRDWKRLAGFCIGGFVGLALVYGPFLCDTTARAGLVAAQQYHAVRGGFDVTWTVGSLSRLVRWYLPIFVVLGLGGFRKCGLLAVGFLAVFAVQMAAPFPYEDYQVPVMALLAVFAAVNFVQIDRPKGALLVLGLCFACSFGSPLLEKWSTNGQDRFWSLKKEKFELVQLRDVAKEIEALDPNGKTLLTQDLYLAIETRRKVPAGLEMGPFAMLSDEEWQALLGSAPCPIAALSGYSFSILPPKCGERPVDRQMEFWKILKRNYTLVSREEQFGQNATPLLILRRK